MAKTTYVCPDCHRQVKDLKGHQARVHSKAEPELKTTGKSLELKIEKPEAKAEPEAKIYHCVECGTAISYRQLQCPGCNTGLDWGSL